MIDDSALKGKSVILGGIDVNAIPIRVPDAKQALERPRHDLPERRGHRRMSRPLGASRALRIGSYGLFRLFGAS